MKTFEITIDTIGRVSVNAQGFSGGECLTKAKPLIDALQNPQGVDCAQVFEKPEMYQEEEQHQTLGL